MRERNEHYVIAMTAAFVVLTGMPAASANEDLVHLPQVFDAQSASHMAATATPMTNPLRSPDTTNVAPEAGDGSLTPGALGEGDSKGASGGPDSGKAYGSFGIPYTTTRVQLGGLNKSKYQIKNLQSITYPYRVIGKLFFQTSQGSSWCSASLIRKAVMVTAAHCFQNFGSGGNSFTNFKFRPGHYGPPGAPKYQRQPFGAWNTLTVARAASWANGTDVGGGAARDNDVALFIVKKKKGQFIGDKVGYLGYGWNNYSFISSSKTGNKNTAAVSTLGYPGLMDSGDIMQRTDGPSYTTKVNGAKQIMQGSNLTGGSSGGPWVVNFWTRNAKLSGGASPGSKSTMAVIGVTSWGARDPNNPKDNYSSQFAQNTRYPNADYGGWGAGNIGSLLNSLCNATAPEGGTYESRGYCN